jgi:hypothetical protein
VDAFEEWCHLLEGTQHDTSLLMTCPWHKHHNNSQFLSRISKVATTNSHETLTPTKKNKTTIMTTRIYVSLMGIHSNCDGHEEL